MNDMDYEVTVRRVPGGAPVRFDVRRRSGGTPSHDVNLSVTVLLRDGRPAVLGRFERPDGSQTVLTARWAHATNRAARSSHESSSPAT